MEVRNGGDAGDVTACWQQPLNADSLVGVRKRDRELRSAVRALLGSLVQKRKPKSRTMQLGIHLSLQRDLRQRHEELD